MNHPASSLRGSNGEQVALRDLAVDARVRDLLAEVNVTQTYRNEEKINIEAVYTFPLPLDAVLLEIRVQLGARVLTGAVVARQQAQTQYEEAVAEGDAAVMLEAIEPGLYTMNVGNLLPGEEAKISFKYALLYRWHGDRLRLSIPTTVAPRYGVSPHQPHQVPETSLVVENRFNLRVEIEGSLRQAQFDCPTHPIAFATEAERTLITLSQERAVMDRDFVLNLRAPQAARGFALAGVDGEGMAALASFQPFFPGVRQRRPLKLAVVIDCSGSMQGDSIEQARQAIAGMLDALQPEDAINLIAFGNGTRVLSKRLLPCDAANLKKARAFAAELNADMGGTVIAGALQAAYASLKKSEHGDIFLITDGEVSDWQGVVKEASRSGHRVFTVGVGSAVLEAFVRGLAQATSAACEMVSPREQMAERVIRHFERMQAPRARRAEILWPAGALDTAPTQAGAVFEGDTIVASARFEQTAVQGEVVLEIETDSGEIMRQAISLALPVERAEDGLSTVARLAAGQRLTMHQAQADAQAGAATALHYRLLSPWTNWLAVAQRSEEERAQDLPALRKVPQTLAAGWGGAGSVMRSRGAMPAPVFAAAPAAAGAPDLAKPAPAGKLVKRKESLLKESIAPMAKPAMDMLSSVFAEPVPAPTLLDLLLAQPARLRAEEAQALLVDAGLAARFEVVFQQAARAGVQVHMLAALALVEILDSLAEEGLSDAFKAALASLRSYAREKGRVLLKLSAAGATAANAALLDEVFEPGPAQALRSGAPLPDLRALLELARGVAREVAQESAMA